MVKIFLFICHFLLLIAAPFGGVLAWGAPLPDDLILDPERIDPTTIPATTLYCPPGSQFDSQARFCTFVGGDGKENVIGPFPEDMMKACADAGGGEACRTSSFWAKDFAVALRGSGYCAHGTQFDARRGVCFAGDDAFGPFPGSVVRRCLEANGGRACLLSRHGLNWFPLRDDTLFCPLGWTYSVDKLVCVSQVDNLALGPFTEAMVGACRNRFPDSGCDNFVWPLPLALELRGDGRCSAGATWDEARGICREDEHAFGPFAFDEVSRCLQLENALACISVRWSSAMFPPRERSSRMDLGRYDFSKPSTVSRTMRLWATNYFLPYYQNGEGNYALRNLSGQSLGVTLTRHQWCRAGMEGSVRVRMADGKIETFNYAGESSSQTVYCADIYPRYPKTGWVKFRMAVGEFGDGVREYKLIPFRTIAVDPNTIPYGSVVYIDGARGAKIELPNGKTVVHDGYFFAGDTGGAIKQNHIDVFTGVQTESPFWWVLSSPRYTTTAKIVTDQKTVEYFRALHTQEVMK